MYPYYMPPGLVTKGSPKQDALKAAIKSSLDRYSKDGFAVYAVVLTVADFKIFAVDYDPFEDDPPAVNGVRVLAGTEGMDHNHVIVARPRDDQPQVHRLL